MSERNLKKIPYGESGFKKIRFGNYLYVDKTRYIEVLENRGTNFPFIVRPRRIGKSLFTETLSAYYDIIEADNFEKNFGGTYIGNHKTPLANKFYILKFNFAGLSTTNVLQEFYTCVLNGIKDFFSKYPHPHSTDVTDKQFHSAAALIESFFTVLGYGYRQKIFVIIDEYDQFANAILSNDLNQFRKITSSDGFLKDFYTKLKSATGDEKPVAKIFITGVTSISLDSMTSGFSIATNLSTHPLLAGLYGFSKEELLEAVPQVLDLQKIGKTAEEVVERMREWYNGYHFSSYTDVSVFHSSMCFYYLQFLSDYGQEPVNLLDPGFAQDLSKISGILKLGNPEFVKTVVTKALQRKPIHFSAGVLQLLNLNHQNEFDEDGILSAMVYLGYLTFVPGDNYSLVVPNRAVAIQFFEYYQRYILASGEFKFNSEMFERAYRALAGGDPKPLFAAACSRFSSGSGLHTHLHLTESDFQTLIAAALYFTDNFTVEREVEARGGEHPGYIDLLIRPTVDLNAPSYLVELKYLTKKDGSESNVKTTLTKALLQARQYSECDNIRNIPRLKRIAAVFVGMQLKELVIEE